MLLRILRHVLPALILAGLAGCPGPKPAAVASKPLAGQTVRIGVPAGLGFRAAWEVPLNEWGAQTGAEARLEELDVTDPSQLLAPAFGEDKNTLLLFPIWRMGELTATGGALAFIPAGSLEEGNLNWLDVLPGLREGVCSQRRQAVVIPLSCPVLVCYYREDLLQKAGLSPPETWDDYQKLLDTLGEWAPGLTAVEPWGEAFRATMFLARAVSYAKHPGHFSLFFDIETGEPLIDSPGFVRALERAKLAIVKMPGDVLKASPEDCRRELLAGRAALAIAFETGPANPPLRFGPAVSGATDVKRTADPNSDVPEAKRELVRPAEVSIGFCRLPGSRDTYNLSRREWEPIADGGVNQVTLAGFAGLAAGVSARSSQVQAEAAWNLLAALTQGNLAVPFPPGTQGPCRESEAANAAAWVGTGLQGTESQRYLSVVAKSLRDKRVVAELPVPGHTEFRRALASAVTAALASQAESQPALAAAAQEWRLLIKDLDKTATISISDTYRASLGIGGIR